MQMKMEFPIPGLSRETFRGSDFIERSELWQGLKHLDTSLLQYVFMIDKISLSWLIRFLFHDRQRSQTDFDVYCFQINLSVEYYQESDMEYQEST